MRGGPGRLTYLLDTNVVSALRRPEREPDVFLAWARGGGAGDAYPSAVTVLEVEQGVLRLERRDPAQGPVLHRWANEAVLAGYARRTLAVDAAVARRAAALHVPDPRPYYDALIAATALVHGLALVMRNVGEFAATGVVLIDPCAGA